MLISTGVVSLAVDECCDGVVTTSALMMVADECCDGVVRTCCSMIAVDVGCVMAVDDDVIFLQSFDVVIVLLWKYIIK